MESESQNQKTKVKSPTLRAQSPRALRMGHPERTKDESQKTKVKNPTLRAQSSRALRMGHPAEDCALQRGKRQQPQNLEKRDSALPIQTPRAPKGLNGAGAYKPANPSSTKMVLLFHWLGTSQTAE